MSRGGRDYVGSLASDPAHLQTLCDRVTVQESGSFRHSEQFEKLARRILPAISGPVLIWSAGCANGQEAYSLEMLMTELGIDGRVLANGRVSGSSPPDRGGAIPTVRSRR
jgi:chemotaxis protein methyltransferase CheR